MAGLLILKFSPRTTNYSSRSKSGSSPALFDVTSAFINTKSNWVYDVIKGDGRALAFYTKPGSEDAQNRYLSAINEISEDNCIILTNKTESPDLHPSEMEFIKEITGHGADDLLVIGFGKPDLVEDKLMELHKRATLPGSHSIDAPRVVS